MKIEAKTQGQDKMFRYVNSLIRNQKFSAILKRLQRYEKELPKGRYDSWSDINKKKHDDINSSYLKIIEDLQTLKRRANRIVRDRAFGIKENLATEYGLSNRLIELAQILRRKDEKMFDFYKSMFEADVDMCVVIDQLEESLSPYNAGEDFIYLSPSKQIRNHAYPVSIAINIYASKRDVIDYVEKNWKHIDSNLRQMYKEKSFVVRKRKYDQDLLDFIWQNQELSTRKIKERLDIKFPKNGLVYFEITKLIALERQRRVGI